MSVLFWLLVSFSLGWILGWWYVCFGLRFWLCLYWFVLVWYLVLLCLFLGVFFWWMMELLWCFVDVVRWVLFGWWRCCIFYLVFWGLGFLVFCLLLVVYRWWWWGWCVWLCLLFCGWLGMDVFLFDWLLIFCCWVCWVFVLIVLWWSLIFLCVWLGFVFWFWLGCWCICLWVFCYWGLVNELGLGLLCLCVVGLCFFVNFVKDCCVVVGCVRFWWLGIFCCGGYYGCLGWFLWFFCCCIFGWCWCGGSLGLGFCGCCLLVVCFWVGRCLDLELG